VTCGGGRKKKEEKGTLKNNYNTTLNILVHTTYFFLPDDGFRTLQKGQEDN
jgi:hypothetical protein